MHVVIGGACGGLALGDHGVLQILGFFLGLLQQAHAALAQLGSLLAGGRGRLLKQFFGIGQNGLHIAHQFLLFAGGWFEW
ncbi:hypothetical protein D3C71_2055830 [compost metagenome]